jgi:hypothetical protein
MLPLRSAVHTCHDKLASNRSYCNLDFSVCMFLYQILSPRKVKKRPQSHEILYVFRICVFVYDHSEGNDNGCSTHLYWNAFRDVT